MQPKVILGLVSWSNMNPSTAVEISVLAGSGLLHGVVECEGSLTVPARNAVVLTALQKYPDFTHLLMIDTDVCGFKPKLLSDMISADVDMISPLTTERRPPYRPHPRSEEDINKIKEALNKPIHERGLIEVEGTGLGCFLISREVIEKTVEYDPKTKNALWFAVDRIPRDSIQEELAELIKECKSDRKLSTEECVRKGFSLGLMSRLHGAIIGEDYYFMEKARKLGFKIFVDLRHCLGHIGNYIYSIEDWLAYEQDSDKKLVEKCKDPRLTPFVKEYEYEEPLISIPKIELDDI